METGGLLGRRFDRVCAGEEMRSRVARKKQCSAVGMAEGKREGMEVERNLSPNVGRGSVERLPQPLVQHIISLLPGDGDGGVCAARRVCRDWRDAVDTAGDQLWHDVFVNQFGSNIAGWSIVEQHRDGGLGSIASDKLSVWKQRYRERVTAGRNWLHGRCRHWHLPDEESIDADGGPVAGGDGGVGSNVCAVAVENSLLVMGMFPGNVEVWDLQTQRKICVMRGHTGYIHSIDVDRFGQFVITASEDRTARMWHVPSGECLAVMEHPEACAEVWWVIKDAVVLPDLAGPANRLLLQDIPNPSEKNMDPQEADALEVPSVVTAMRLLDEDEDAEFLLWEAQRPAESHGGPIHSTIVRRYDKAYMFDRRTGVLAMAGSSKHMRLHHVMSKVDLAEVKLDIAGKIKDVFFGHSHCHGWQLIVGSDSREVVVLDLCSQGLVSSFQYTPVEEITMFSLNERLFCLTASLQRPALPESSRRTAGFRVWDACKGDRMGGALELEVFGTPCDALEFDSQQPGKPNVTVVLAGADGKVTLWTLPDGERAELPCSMSLGEHGWLVAESNWRWLAVRDTSGVHVFDFLV